MPNKHDSARNFNRILDCLVFNKTGSWQAMLAYACLIGMGIIPAANLIKSTHEYYVETPLYVSIFPLAVLITLIVTIILTALDAYYNNKNSSILRLIVLSIFRLCFIGIWLLPLCISIFYVATLLQPKVPIQLIVHYSKTIEYNCTRNCREYYLHTEQFYWPDVINPISHRPLYGKIKTTANLQNRDLGNCLAEAKAKLPQKQFASLKCTLKPEPLLNAENTLATVTHAPTGYLLQATGILMAHRIIIIDYRITSP